MERIWHSQRKSSGFDHKFNWMSSVNAETIVILTMCHTSVLLQLLFICLSITSACMGNLSLWVIFLSNSSLSIPYQIKYQEPVHTFVHRFLLHQRTSALKLKHLYFLLISRDFHHQSIPAVIMPDRIGNSVSSFIALARIEFSEAVLNFK